MEVPVTHLTKDDVMNRFRARDDDGKGEFEVDSLHEMDARTRRSIARTVVVGGMSALVLAVGVFALRGDDARLLVVLGVISNLVSFQIGQYFGKGKDG